ncbi:MAG: DUF5317 domain-containing protein [Actinomycetota bacterium]|nr:DUF5317 domain-containing protein [Actinomycetota bacterium]
MALIPTLLAIGIGLGLGVHWGGQLGNVAEWRPPLWEALVGGAVVLVLLDVIPAGGTLVTLCWLLATAALLAFAVLNVRVGGMVLVVAGLAMNLLVGLFNWGMPVSGSALVSAGIVDEGDLDRVVLHGGRTLSDGAFLGFLGHTIPLPWGVVVSIGDLLVLVGIALVTASVTRRYEVGGGRRPRRRSGPNDYRNALDALGRGPAPRRGPGLHPSRMKGTTRRRPPR